MDTCEPRGWQVTSSQLVLWGLPQSQWGELQAHTLHSPPRNALHCRRLPPALLPRPRRAPAGRRPRREGAQSGCPSAGPAGPRWPPRPAPSPAPRFCKLQRTRRPPETPPVGSKLCALQRRSDSHKVCAAEPIPYLRWGRARPRRSGAGPAGSCAQPGMHREFATVAAARAPRRPRGASASR